MSAVRTRALTRQYGGGRKGTPVHGLRGVELGVEEGEVHGLLGPNGAGKTTLCRILSTVLLPTSGSAEVMGLDVARDADRVKRSIGIVFGGERGLYGRLTVRENIRFWAALYGLHGAVLRRRSDALLERMGLAERAADRVDTLSRGMKQRLHLARGLVSDPPVLILDEPTVGMDPVAAHDFRALIGELRQDRRTVLLTTHDMAEAAAVCDRVSLVDRGRVIATKAPAEVGELVSRHERVEARGVAGEVAAAVGRLPGVVAIRPLDGERVRIETEDAAATRAVLRLLVDAGITELATSRPTLEEVYLHLMGDRGMAVRP
ncbi:ATP-binding cassette domain-containing protein [Streptomyces sp. SHP 1-2]|uniref:ABC transporter ATP-binding protein n=1 Tax=Streptomyces sp. SHP 1-2 TaxID=2769489 RepID=UPI00223801C1|nr:ABC transporter ATP-binding protein [Streptomyces sp. SHP 1-2]MCW5250344.1 ABC transporter ATP-binding protein [Streptomyces sp. SHP 1-2]